MNYDVTLVESDQIPRFRLSQVLLLFSLHRTKFYLGVEENSSYFNQSIGYLKRLASHTVIVHITYM